MASQTSPGAAKRPRPLSPHLQIYKPQITSVLSISHRITGVALGVGTVLLAAWIVAAAMGPAAYGRVAGLIGSWFGQMLLFGWSVALFYHLLNGIRHLFWDAGRGFELPEMERSGKAVVAGTVVLTAVAWILAKAG
jgi:succinate dehydrogenase / fumarate reductase cytochrome b subunit